MHQPTYIRSAHGAAAEGGAILVCEQPPLDEIPTIERASNPCENAPRSRVGRAFPKGNRAAAGRGPSLTRITVDPMAPDLVRSLNRRAQTLRSKRVRELSKATGGPLSSAVLVELTSWAMATTYSQYYYATGDAKTAASMAEKASAHNLKSVGLAEREAAAKPPVDLFEQACLEIAAEQAAKAT